MKSMSRYVWLRERVGLEANAFLTFVSKKFALIDTRYVAAGNTTAQPVEEAVKGDCLFFWALFVQFLCECESSCTFFIAA